MRKAIRRIILHNFQSHEHTSLELDPGVNVIIGPSDTGKTAVIRGLRWLYYNEPRGTGFIRAGSTECWVEVELEDGTRVRRQRNERLNCYVIEQPGQEPLVLDRIAGTVPEEVRLALGAARLALDQDSELELNVSSQLDGPFLLGSPGTVRARAVGRLGDVHVVDAAQKDLQRDIRSLGLLAGRVEAEAQELAQKEASLAYVDEWEQRLNEAKGLVFEARRLEAEVAELIELRDRWQQTEESLARARTDLKDFAHLQDAEQAGEKAEGLLMATGRLQALADRYEETARGLAVARNTVASTAGLEEADLYAQQLVRLWEEGRRAGEVAERRAVALRRWQEAEIILDSTAAADEAAAAALRISALMALAQGLEAVQRDWAAKNKALAEANGMAQRTAGLDEAEKVITNLFALRELGVSLQAKAGEAARLLKAKSMKIKDHHQAARLVEALGGLEQAEECLGRAEGLRSVGLRLAELGELRQRCRVRLSAVEQEIEGQRQEQANMLEEYLQTLGQMGRCPLCQTELDEEHLATIRRQLEEEWNYGR